MASANRWSLLCLALLLCMSLPGLCLWSGDGSFGEEELGTKIVRTRELEPNRDSEVRERILVQQKEISVDKNVTIEYTEQGVPFITAGNEYDLLYAMGRTVAEYRLWQMEFWKRFMLGTLSEIFGEVTVELDISARRNNWAEVIAENIANTPQFYLDRTQAYIDGVNSFLVACSVDNSLLPPEYAQYGAPFPSNYTIADTFLIVKAMAKGLSGNANLEVGNEQVIQSVGIERFFFLQSRDPSWPHIIPPNQHSDYPSVKTGSSTPSSRDFFEQDVEMVAEEEGEEELSFEHSVAETDEQKEFWKKTFLPSVEAARQALSHVHFEDGDDSDLKHYLSTFPAPGANHASNNWAISGKYTFTGKPLLCNDPHLLYMAPDVWILIGLNIDTPDSNFQELVGVSVVLAPGMAIGRNKYLAWGYTTNKADSQDYFQMENNDDNTAYYYNGTLTNYIVKNATIQVKDAASVSAELLFSVYGPVIQDGANYYSLCWSAFDNIDTSLAALYDSNVARNYDEWRSAMSQWYCLMFNAVYADTAGNIGMQITGRNPIRAKGAFGDVPRPGNGEWNWVGYVEWDDMPYTFNPEQGFVVSANNSPGNFTEFENAITGDYVPAFRAQRIIDLIFDAIDNDQLMTVGYMEQIHADVTSLVFSYLYPALEKVQASNSFTQTYLDQVLQWDGIESKSSTEAALWEYWQNCLYNVTFYETGAATVNPWIAAVIFNNATEYGGDVSCQYWDMSCQEYASYCFQAAVDAYVPLLPYGIQHIALFPHIPPVPLDWNRVAEVGGDKWTPNACTFTINIPGLRETPVLGGPSFRLIADMSGQTPTQMIIPMGESGDPNSPHYDDMLKTWDNVEYYTLDWNALN